MDIRKLHNSVKRHLIQSVSKPGLNVLDVGCGRGGDIFKWLDCKVKLSVCDPCKDALVEARKRCGPKNVKFYDGDITHVPGGVFDILCYNFSLQYTFANEELFTRTTESIQSKSHVGTKLVGIVPNSDFILNHSKFIDSHGNYFMRGKDTGNGDYGEKVWVCVKNTLYYENDEPISEPIAYKDILVTRLQSMGWVLNVWEPMIHHSTGLISDMYAQFIFTRIE
jgi:SAM-dependent methyltransferase